MTSFSSKFIGLFLCITLVFSALAVFGFDVSKAEPSVPETRAGGIANWTVIVYISGDSSLSDMVDDDLEEMRSVGSGDGLEIVTLADKNGNGDTRIHHVLETGPEVFMPNVVNSTWNNELNLGDPDVLVEFVLWASQSYPAKNYMLDLWGHGIGWEGIATDKGDKIEAYELKDALVELNANGFHPDIVSMDACQMSMLEILYQMKGLADYSVASEKDVPAAGWPYDRVLNILRQDSSLTPEEFGSEFIDEYIVWGISGNSGYSLTLSLVNISALEGVAAALDELAKELILDAGYFHPEIRNARKMTEKYDGDNQFDLGHLAYNLAMNTTASVFDELNENMAAAIDEAVIYERHWTLVGDEPADNATGISIWFPTFSPYYKYSQLDISLDTRWDEFLEHFSLMPGGDLRNDSALTVALGSYDTDGDGLNDTIGVSASAGPELEITVQIFDDGDTLVHSVSGSGAIDNVTWALPTPGRYSAEVYVRDANGILLNHTKVINGLNSEMLYTISGRVTSNTGKALGWVKITVTDENLGFSEDVYTDSKGRYEIELVSPWQTDGIGIMITSYQGTYTQNVSLDALALQNEINFSIPDGPDLTLPIMYLALSFNFMAIACLAYYVTRRSTNI